jgi:hypothetical protein
VPIQALTYSLVVSFERANLFQIYLAVFLWVTKANKPLFLENWIAKTNEEGNLIYETSVVFADFIGLCCGV